MKRACRKLAIRIHFLYLITGHWYFATSNFWKGKKVEKSTMFRSFDLCHVSKLPLLCIETRESLLDSSYVEVWFWEYYWSYLQIKLLLFFDFQVSSYGIWPITLMPRITLRNKFEEKPLFLSYQGSVIRKHSWMINE